MSMTENHTIAELLYENGKLSAELEAERFMIQQITSLSSTELIDDGINTVLREVGEYTCADRAYVFEINEDYTTTNTYEWCKEGVTPQIDNLKGIPFESMPKGGNILIEELEDIKAEMPQEYRRNLLRSTDWYLVDYQARGKRTGNGGRCKYA